MEKLFLVLGSIAFIVFISFVLSWPVYMLWNGCLVDAIEGVKTVTWMQAWGLSLLFGLLFKNNTSNSK